VISVVHLPPLGNIRLSVEDEKLIQLEFASETAELSAPADEISKHIIHQIKKYLSNPAHGFEVECAAKGTAFQRKIWQALSEIPSGKTLTYAELARKLKTSPRAIGQACRKNPIPLIVPCHRIVGTSNQGGYAGKQTGRMMEIKSILLKHELNLKESHT